MGMRCCACSLTSIFAVAGLLGLGAAGYRVASGGCGLCHQDAGMARLVSTSNQTPVGTCPGMNMTHEQLGHTKLVGAEERSGCCAGMTEAECQAKMAQCPAHGGCCGQQNDEKKPVAPEKVASTNK
jgi:hypothetical protein